MNKKELKSELVRYGRRISERALVIGPGGNISARLGNTVYMKASGIAFEDAKESDYIGVNLQTGKVIEGELRPTSEYQMHLLCYMTRKDVGAVIHSHPPLSVAYGMLGRTLKPHTPDFVAYIKTDVPVIGYVIPTGRELAEAVSRIIKKHNGVLMMNHGLLTVGTNLKEAFYRTLLIEDTVKTLIAAKIMGKMKFLTGEQVRGINNLKAEAYRRALLKKMK